MAENVAVRDLRIDVPQDKQDKSANPNAPLLVSPRKKSASHQRSKTATVSSLRRALRESFSSSNFSPFGLEERLGAHDAIADDISPGDLSGRKVSYGAWGAVIGPATDPGKLKEYNDDLKNLQIISSREVKEYNDDRKYQKSLQEKLKKVRELLQAVINEPQPEVPQLQPAAPQPQAEASRSKIIDQIAATITKISEEIANKNLKKELDDFKLKLEQGSPESFVRFHQLSENVLDKLHGQVFFVLRAANLKGRDLKSLDNTRSNLFQQAELEGNNLSTLRLAESEWLLEERERFRELEKEQAELLQRKSSELSLVESEYLKEDSKRKRLCQLAEKTQDTFETVRTELANLGASFRKLGQNAIAQIDDLIQLIQRLKDEGDSQSGDAREQLNMLRALKRKLKQGVRQKDLIKSLPAVLHDYQIKLKDFEQQLTHGLDKLNETITEQREKLKTRLSPEEKEDDSSLDKKILKEREVDIEFLSHFLSYHELFKHTLNAYQRMAESEPPSNLAALKEEIFIERELLIHKACELISDPGHFIAEIKSAYREVFFEEPKCESESTHLIAKDDIISEDEDVTAESGVYPVVRKCKKEMSLSARVDAHCGTINNYRLLLTVRVPRVLEKFDGAFLGKAMTDTPVGKICLAVSTVPVLGSIVAALNCMFYGLRWLVLSYISLKNRWGAIKEEEPELSYLGMSQRLIKSSFTNKKEGDKTISQVDCANKREEALRGYKKRNDFAWFSMNALCGFFANDLFFVKNETLTEGMVECTFNVSLGPLLIIMLYLFDCWNARKRLRDLEENFEPFKQKQSEQIKALEKERDELEKEIKEQKEAEAEEAMKEQAPPAAEEKQKRLDVLNARLKLKKEAWDDMHIKYLQKKIDSKVGYQVAKSLLVLTVGYYLSSLALLSLGAITLGFVPFVFAGLVVATHLSSMYMKWSVNQYVELALKGEIGQLSKKSFLLLQASGVTDAKDIRDYVKQTRASQKSTGLLSRCTLGFLERKATKLEKRAAADPDNEIEAGKSKSDLTLLNELARKRRVAPHDDAQQESAMDEPEVGAFSYAC